MKGDFTRLTHDPKKHYSGVLQQQGRVSVDADWNEYVQIQDYLRLTGNRDIIGHCGVPNNTRDGFLIGRSADNSLLVLESGGVTPARIYVDGIMCQIEKDVVIPNPAGSGTYLAYLDVWQRHITVVEDSEIAEVALGGPDTTTRIKTEWQVRLKEISADLEKKILDLKKFCSGEYAWSPEEYASTGKMAARAEQPDAKEEICDVEARGGYRGLENRLYRVEIHKGGNPAAGSVTFKWSRDNGSVVFPVQKIEFKDGKSRLVLKQSGKDDVLTLHVGDWVEISDDRDDLALKVGILAQVAQGSDMSKGLVVLETDVSAYQTPNHPKIRRWDQKDSSEVNLTNGTVAITADTWLPLEDGVEVSFKAGTYKIGDYWLIPARTRLRDVLWDVEGNNPVYESRHGTEHHYCALAVAEFSGKVWGEPEDLRHIFFSLNELYKSCCITVRPGENIQRVIDCVIASGGGCICLCKGVHHVQGPLMLEKARNLTICAENAATVVHFEGTNEDGEGGFVMNGCTGISVTGMLVVGDDVPSLFTLKSSAESQPNLDISLESLSIYNRAAAKGDEPGSKCAIRVGHAGDINIENCRMMAENGIISLFGDELPDPGILENPDLIRNIKIDSRLGDIRTHGAAQTKLDYGIGVYQLSMKDSMILFRGYGIWTLKSVGWKLDNCRLTALPEMSRDGQGNLDSKLPYQAILDYLEKASFGEPVSATGTAIKALIWKDCQVKGCTMSGAIGMNISLWLGGEAVENRIKARYGLTTLWLHDAAWHGNTIDGNNVGMSLCGSFRSRIEGNKVRSRIGLENGSLGEWLSEVDSYLDEIVRAYNITDGEKAFAPVALWMLLEEACEELKLTQLRDALQELLNTFEAYKGIPVLLLAGISLYPKLDSIAKASAKIPVPIIALTVKDNEIEAARGIRFINFIPVGGLNISGNRIQTLKGQAILVKANPYTINPYAVIVLWRFFYRMLPTISQRLAAAMSSRTEVKNLSDERKAAIIKIFNGLEKLILGLNNIIEPVLEADYRIESNSIRSHRTAIETTIFQMAIQNNHITIEESEYSNQEALDIIDILGKYDATRDMAAGMRQRSKTLMQIPLDEMKPSEETNADFMNAASELQKKTSRTDLQKEASNLYQSAKDADAGKISEAMSRVVEILAGYVDDCGIWIKGAGCRVVGNHIVVPPDADSKTWSQGGIRFWDDEGSPIWVLAFLEALLQLYLPGLDLSSLLGASETLIDNNEIVRGAGHGIEINGITNMPLGMGLADIKIRGNQIQEMAGAGIAFDEKSLTVGADIEGNRILDCGSPALTSIVDKKGGLIIRNTAGCRIHNNRIRGASNLEMKSGIFIVDIQKVYGLTLTNNYLQHSEVSNYKFNTEGGSIGRLVSNSSLISLAMANLCGVIRLSELQGEATIQNNEILLSRGVGAGLVMGSLDTGAGKFWDVTTRYMNLKSRFIGLTEDVGSAAEANVARIVGTSSVQGNHFESLEAGQFYAFLIAGLQELNFSGNNVRSKNATLSPGYILGVIRGVVNNNMLDTLAISMSSGVLTGNVSNMAIAPPAGVTNGLNNP